MRWDKRGRVYEPRARAPWGLSHAQHPVVHAISPDRIRVYYSTRDGGSRSVTTYLEARADDPREILYRHDRPVLGLGELGCFDDGGAMASWTVESGGILHLYYIGWNAGVTVSYRNAIGLAVSDDGGRTFARPFRGPVADRTREEPFFCGGHCVLVENGVWRMWYLAATGWILEGGKPEPLYDIKYAESPDGAAWRRTGIVCIGLREGEGGISRPCVLKQGDGYRMWYSRRGRRAYRTDSGQSYRIGYAESADGLRWERMDDRVGIDVSPGGWDSAMIEYAHVYPHGGRLHMIYNGNGFGASGFGHAVLEEDPE